MLPIPSDLKLQFCRKSLRNNRYRSSKKIVTKYFRNQRRISSNTRYCKTQACSSANGLIKVIRLSQFSLFNTKHVSNSLLVRCYETRLMVNLVSNNKNDKIQTYFNFSLSLALLSLHHSQTHKQKAEMKTSCDLTSLKLSKQATDKQCKIGKIFFGVVVGIGSVLIIFAVSLKNKKGHDFTKSSCMFLVFVYCMHVNLRLIHSKFCGCTKQL